LVEAFRHHKQHHGNPISTRTWKRHYKPFAARALEALAAGDVSDARGLIERVAEAWRPGSRRRQIAAQNLAQLLAFGVERHGLAESWAPPSILKTIVGRTTRAKRVGYPLTDTQIQRLLQGLPAGECSDRWRFALQLMSAYGLRPEDLRYLQIRDGRPGAGTKSAAAQAPPHRGI
jgi:integrase